MGPFAIATKLRRPNMKVAHSLALGVIEWAEKHGQLKPGQVSLEQYWPRQGIVRWWSPGMKLI